MSASTRSRGSRPTSAAPRRRLRALAESQLVEHIQIAHGDIIDFGIHAAYQHTMKWPDDCCAQGRGAAAPRTWTDSVALYTRAREDLKRLAREVAGLTSTVSTGKGHQTYLRAILLADTPRRRGSARRGPARAL